MRALEFVGNSTSGAPWSTCIRSSDCSNLHGSATSSRTVNLAIAASIAASTSSAGVRQSGSFVGASQWPSTCTNMSDSRTATSAVLSPFHAPSNPRMTSSPSASWSSHSSASQAPAGRNAFAELTQPFSLYRMNADSWELFSVASKSAAEFGNICQAGFMASHTAGSL